MKGYNFYGFLLVRFDYHGHRGYAQYFENEYARITQHTRSIRPEVNITVRIVKELPQMRKDDIQRSARFKRLFTYQYLVRGLWTDHVEIFFLEHPVDKVYMNAIGVFLQAQVLEPIMYLKFLQRDILFMHAGGVARGGQGYLLPAHGGTGKTTFSIALMNNGFQLLGDDLLIVDTKKKVVYPYPRPMHIFTYNINNLEGGRVPLKYRVAIHSKNSLRYVLERIFRTPFLISTRIHADEIFSGDLFAKPVPYKAVFFLRKTGGAAKRQAIGAKNVRELAEEIMISADLNDSLFEMLRDQKSITRVQSLERRVISRLLGQFDHLTYLNTRELNLHNLRPFINQHF